MAAWLVYTNANLFFDKKKNRKQAIINYKEKQKMSKYASKLTILQYDNFGGNQTPLHRNGMAAIPKIAL